MSLTTGLLIAAILGLLLGPLLLRLRASDITWQAALDGFVIVTVGGIAVLHLLPEAFAHQVVVVPAPSVAGDLPCESARIGRSQVGIVHAENDDGLSVWEQRLWIGAWAATGFHPLHFSMPIFSKKTIVFLDASNRLDRCEADFVKAV